MIAVFKSIIHLIVGSVGMAVSWMGTTVLAVAVLAAPFVVRLVVGYKEDKWSGVSKALGPASLYTIGVWSILFFIGVTRFIYRDHTSLAASNKAMSQTLEQLQHKSQRFEVSLNNPDFDGFVDGTMAFTFLSNPSWQSDAQQRCDIRVTAPKENTEIARVLETMAGSTGCYTEPLGNADTNPDIEAEAENGMIPDFILIHMNRTNEKRDAFVGTLQNVFSVKRSYEIPPGKPDNFVWLQVGSGNPWRKP